MDSSRVACQKEGCGCGCVVLDMMSGVTEGRAHALPAAPHPSTAHQKIKVFFQVLKIPPKFPGLL
jgi:hypothetical protein